MNPLKQLQNLYLGLRYTLPLWIDRKTTPPLIRTLNHRLFHRNFPKRVKMVMRMYEIACGYSFDIQNPQTLNEKIQWLKLFHPDPLMTQCADKYRVRDYIRETIGEQYLAPLLGVFDHPNEIDFSALPDQFALKVNWGSGQNYICKNRAELDVRECRRTLRKWLKPQNNQFFFGLEWAYRDIQPKIVCEEYLEFLEKDHKTFQFFCFNGEPRVVQVLTDVKTPNIKADLFDLDWNWLPINKGVPNSPLPLQKPEGWELMVELATRLCKPFPFVRVDLFLNESQSFSTSLPFTQGVGWTCSIRRNGA